MAVPTRATALGYTATTLWHGSLSDSGRVTPEQIVGFANQCFLPQHIVIGHANFDAVTRVDAQLVGILHKRSLETVTLRDIFAVCSPSPAMPLMRTFIGASSS